MRYRTPIQWAQLLLVLSMMASGQIWGDEQGSSDANAETSFEDVKEETKEAISTLRAYSVNQRDQAIQDAKATLDRLDQRLDSLESKIDSEWTEMTEGARQNARETVQSLRKQRLQLSEWYGSMKSSSDAAWEELKTGFVGAYQELEDAWQEAAKKFEGEPATEAA